MAVIIGVGEIAPRLLRGVAEAAFLDVAQRLCQLGLGSTAIMHGSAATRGVTFIETGSVPQLAADVDILLRYPLEGELTALQHELTLCYLAALGAHAGPASRVSVKQVNPQFLGTTEAPSLLLSTDAAGLTARRARRGARGWLPAIDRVAFPYAMEYGAWRWATLADGSPDERALATYELLKGLTRAAAKRGLGVVHESRLTTPEEMMHVLLAREFELHRRLPPYTRGVVSAWLRWDAHAETGMSIDALVASRAELARIFRREIPNSILATRSQPTREEVAA